MVIIFGVGMMIAGFICIFRKDLAWKWQKWSNDAHGVVSERTQAWESNIVITGVLFILGGLFMFWLNSL